MLNFFKRSKGPVICQRKEHCISRNNIDPDALKVLYRLSRLGYEAYLVGGGVRDLLLGRTPKDFDVGTSARPNEVRRAFRNCFLIGRRFRLAHVIFGSKVIETTTFRGKPPSVGDVIESAARGAVIVGDNTFGTPEEDANRRDFTVNGLFYDIKTFAVIDYVGGLKDLKRKVLRSIGDPMERFKEDPVRMMRAVKFASRLDFTLHSDVKKAMHALHSEIKKASVPRVCEEVYRLFSFSSSEKAFRMLWSYGLLADLLPDLAAFITTSGGEASPVWRYLHALDAYTTTHEEVSNGVRTACLYYAMYQAAMEAVGEEATRGLGRSHVARDVLSSLSRDLRVPKATYFTAAVLMDTRRRFEVLPPRGRVRFVYQAVFSEAMDFNRILAAAEGLDTAILDAWDALHAREMARRTQADGTPVAMATDLADEMPESGEKTSRRRRGGRRHHHAPVKSVVEETQVV